MDNHIVLSTLLDNQVLSVELKIPKKQCFKLKMLDPMLLELFNQKKK